MVVEGCGNHGCEYMTGGLALILGEVGQNFAAGMTGGVAYVFDQYGTLDARVQPGHGAPVPFRRREIELIRSLIQEHVDATQSPRGIKLLYSFETMSKHFVKVIPTEYERVLAIVAAGEAAGKTHAQARSWRTDAVAPTPPIRCHLTEGRWRWASVAAILEHEGGAAPPVPCDPVQELRPVEERSRDFDRAVRGARRRRAP